MAGILNPRRGAAAVGLCLGLAVGLARAGVPLLAASSPAPPPVAGSPVPDGGPLLQTPPVHLNASAILDEVLRASGLEDPMRRSSYARAFSSALARIQKHVGTTGTRYRKARRLHDALHKHVFKRYVGSADGIDAILDRGDFNCVSATLFYGIVARAMGMDMRVVETPRHIFLQLEDEGRAIDIETTSPMGFDFRGDLERFRRITGAYAFSMSQDITRRPPYARFDRYETPLQPPVIIERATAFLWHNTAERALARGDARRAAFDLAEEYRAYPTLAVRLDEFAMSLARAFRIEYESGRFETAFQIALIELEIFPRKTSSRDRVLAVASKQIERACEGGDAAAAEAILERVGGVITVATDMSRLERETCPFIAAAAVRVEDWSRAHRMASRYAAVETDRVESGRFIEWVASRESNSKNGAEICWEPRWAPRRAAFTDEAGGARPHSYEEGPETPAPAEPKEPGKRRRK